MSKPLKIRWLVVLGIWLFSLVATYWNLDKIDAVIRSRTQMEQLRKEIFFQSQKAGSLNEVGKLYRAMYYSAPSVKLGLISIENQMEGLADSYGLTAVDLQSQVDAGMNDQVVCTLFMQGGLAQIFRFLSDMNQYPYLPVRRFHLQALPSEDRFRGEVEFVFQYRLPSEDGEQETSWQAPDQVADVQGDAI